MPEIMPEIMKMPKYKLGDMVQVDRSILNHKVLHRGPMRVRCINMREHEVTGKSIWYDLEDEQATYPCFRYVANILEQFLSPWEDSHGEK